MLRPLICICALLGFIGCAAAQEPPSQRERLPPDLSTRSGADWPAFLGPAGDSRSPAKGIPQPWPRSGPRVVWQRELGTSYGIGTVSRGRYFQFDRFDDRARLYALNAETGQPLWKYEYATDYRDLYGYNGGPRTSPVVDGPRVYAYGVEGRLICCDAETGKLRWEVDTQEKFGVVQNFFGVGSTPLIHGDLLIVMVGGSPSKSRKLPPGALDRVEANGSAIVAFDKRTGKVKYKLGDDLASYAGLQQANIDGQAWVFAFCREGLLGFDPASGKQQFSFPWRARKLESVNASTPVVVGNEVFISETYGPGSALLKVQPGMSKVVWQDDPQKRDKAMQAHWNTPVYHQGYLYGSSGRHEYNAELRCVEWKTGNVMWSEPRLTRSSLLGVGDDLICLSEDGVLRLLKANPEKYDRVSEVFLRGDEGEPLLDSPCWAAPILARGLLYIRGSNRVVCLEVIPSQPE